jgi:hypothetical protein
MLVWCHAKAQPDAKVVIDEEKEEEQAEGEV